MGRCLLLESQHGTHVTPLPCPGSWAPLLASITATADKCNHSNLGTFESLGNTINHYTDTKDIMWAHPRQAGTSGQTTCQTQKAHSFSIT